MAIALNVQLTGDVAAWVQVVAEREGWTPQQVLAFVFTTAVEMDYDGTLIHVDAEPVVMEGLFTV